MKNKFEKYNNISEIVSSSEERLGLAWCRMNLWEWDNLFGTIPVDFENNKYKYLRDPMNYITDKIGYKNCLKYWWKFHLHKTEEEFENWWNNRE